MTEPLTLGVRSAPRSIRLAAARRGRLPSPRKLESPRGGRGPPSRPGAMRRRAPSVPACADDLDEVADAPFLAG